MELIIAEKPSVGRAIASALGANERKTAIWKATEESSAGALAIWSNWRFRRNTMPATNAGAIRICPFYLKNGSTP